RKTCAYQDINYGWAQSYSIPGGDLFVTQQHNYRAKQYTQEFQLIGSIGDYVEYTGGLYYFKETGSHLQEQQIAASTFLAPYTYVSTSRLVDAKSISKAAYLQVTLTPPVLEERLKLTLGGRYTEDKRTAIRNQAFFGFPFEVDVSNRQKFHNFSPSVNLAMQWTRDLMTYVRYSRGYKAGGSAESALDFTTATYGPEKVEAWEAGLKSQFLDRKVTFNASLFYNKFKNLQVDFGVDPYDLTKVATANAGRAEIKGVEVELEVRPVRSAGLRVTYAYLDPKLKQILAPAGTLFDPALNTFSPVDVGDDVTSYFTLPFVPKNSVTVSGDWTVLDDGERTLTAYASYMYQGSMYTSSVAGPGVAGREYWKSQAREVVNARLVWKQPIEDVDVSFAVFVNNLFDRRAREFVIGVGQQVPNSPYPAGYFSQTAPYSEPRVIGAEIKASF
ncbi:MAG: TonB-dependent receptor, partial [Novosphingobium sp.]|nr:TonB-dependent receptor [Novosphingobium sp.]